jgi:hypothetical protein
MNMDGMRSVADFEVIDIVDESQPYQTLMVLEWEFDNHAVMNLKNRKIIFEVGELKAFYTVVPNRRKEIHRANKRKQH